MSIRQKVGSVLNRNPTSLEAEREQAIQNFFITLQKVSLEIFFTEKFFQENFFLGRGLGD